MRWAPAPAGRSPAASRCSTRARLSRSGSATVVVLEVEKRPPQGILDKITARLRHRPPTASTVILTPTRSLAGTVQIVARALEVALQQAASAALSLDQVIDGMACAPLPPPAKSFVAAMGRTNDAIIYGGTVQLFVGGPDAAARDLAATLPSHGARDHGRPFAEIFASYEGRFYDIDPLLFSPARVVVTALDSGNSFTGGALDEGADRPLLRARRWRLGSPSSSTARRIGTPPAARRLPPPRRRSGCLLSLAACGFSLDSASGLDLPGSRQAAIRSAGQDHRRRHLRAGDDAARRAACAPRVAGVPVANDARAIERCVDKSMNQLPAPPRRPADAADLDDGGAAAAAALVEREAGPGRPLVLKPLFGSQGRGPAAGRDHRRPAAAGGRRWRLLPAALCRRHGERMARLAGLRHRRQGRGGDEFRHGVSWRTTPRRVRAARASRRPASSRISRPAPRTRPARSMAGSTSSRDAAGRLQVLEVNSNPAWAALQRVSAINIAQALADHLLALAAVARRPRP